MAHWPHLRALVEKEALKEIDLYFAKSVLEPFSLSDQESCAGLLAFLFALSRQGHLALHPTKTFAAFPEWNREILLKGLQQLPEEIVEKVHLEEPYSSKWIYCSGEYVYLQKNWIIEHQIVQHLLRLHCKAPRLLSKQHVEGSRGNALQRQAVQQALDFSLTLLTGGPGTGKTFTAVEIIRALLEQLSLEERKNFKVILTAPTGKAVAQIDSALKKALKDEGSIQSGTIHSLLRGKMRGEKIQLSADLILVDECSMLDAALFAELAAAIEAGTRLVLIGDKDQLPPVEAGSIFADLIDSGVFKTTQLQECLRSDREAILQCASHIKQGEAKEAFAIQSADLEWRPLASNALPPISGTFFYTAHPNPEQLLADRERFALLSCTRKGAMGVEALNRAILHRLMRQLPEEAHFFALPIMITKNAQEMQLFNGDQGVLLCAVTPSRSYQELALEDFAYFPDRSGVSSFRKIPALSLPAFEHCFALSVHKSQGSEYDEVVIVAAEGAENFGREVLYTAVTRARKKVTIFGSEKILKEAIEKSSRKHSGICESLQRKLTQAGSCR